MVSSFSNSIIRIFLLDSLLKISPSDFNRQSSVGKIQTLSFSHSAEPCAFAFSLLATMNYMIWPDLLITFGSILIVAKPYLQNSTSTTMSQAINEQNTARDDTQSDARPCGCERKTCAIGIASVAIGVGGFVLASLL